MLYNPVKPTEVSVRNRIDLTVVPLEALGSRTRNLVAELLNQKRIFTSEDGHFRDWRGMFDVIGIPKSFLPLVSSNPSPTHCLLELWQNEAQQCKRQAHLAELQCVLGCIDRWDVLDDTSKMFDQDAEQFLLREQKRLTQKTQESEARDERLNATVDDDIITRDDTPEHKQRYDAFILYADADIEFATKMVERLEERGMKLCLKDRDILGGSNFEHEVILRLIAERCRRVVVILSKAFLEIPLNDYKVNFAQALQIEQKERKLIPCVYDRCVLPPHLRFTCLLDYQRSLNMYNFWDKLANSIRHTPSMTGRELTDGDATVQRSMASTRPIKIPSSRSESKEEPALAVKLPTSMEKESHPTKMSSPQSIPKVFVEEPTLVVKLPTPVEQESRSGSLKKSHSFWDIFTSQKKDRLNSSGSQLNIADVTPSTSPKKFSSSPLGLIRRHKKLPFAGASSAPPECPLGEKDPKPKKKWYKPTGRKVATAV